MYAVEREEGKERSSFLKKRSKKLLLFFSLPLVATGFTHLADRVKTPSSAALAAPRPRIA
jgi:hypothetical protein